jgi:hypothetical protein
MDLGVALTALEAEIEPLERLLRIFAATLNAPHLRRGDGNTRIHVSKVGLGQPEKLSQTGGMYGGAHGHWRVKEVA